MATLTERLDATIDRAIADNRIVGAVVIVREQGQVMYESARGHDDREAGTPMAVDRIFRFSSLTKPIVAATILALIDAGEMALDDLVTDYLSYFMPRLSDGSAPAITIGQLLTHTSGVGEPPPLSEAEKTDPRYIDVDFDRWHLSLDHNMERLARVPLAFMPGTAWSYGQSIDVLGAVAGGLVGGTLGDAVARYVTGPLGMVDTAFHATDPGRLAKPYADGANGAVPMTDPQTVLNEEGEPVIYSPARILDPRAYHSGGGGMAGTAHDFMALLGALRQGGGPILRPETVAAGLSNQIPQLPFGPEEGVGFGFFGSVILDPKAAHTPQGAGTSRWGGIYGHNWFIDPVAGLEVLSMSNTGLEGCNGAFREEVRDAVYGVSRP